MAASIQDLPGEKWKPVVGYEGLYDVSNLGRVKSLARVVTCSNGTTRTIRERIRKFSHQWSGHRTLVLSDKAQRLRLIHRLVLESFVGPCPEGMECCHNDGDPTNNRLENLRWDTYRANRRDMVRHGRSGRGEKNNKAKLVEADVLAIRARLAKGDTVRAIAKDYGISPSTAHAAGCRNTWTHV